MSLSHPLSQNKSPVHAPIYLVINYDKMLEMVDGDGEVILTQPGHTVFHVPDNLKWIVALSREKHEFERGASWKRYIVKVTTKCVVKCVVKYIIFKYFFATLFRCFSSLSRLS